MKATESLFAVGAAAEEPAPRLAGLLNAAHFLHNAIQVVIIGDRNEAATRLLLGALMGRSVPGQVLGIVPPGEILPESHPARYKTQVDGQATAYVCRRFVCQRPVTDPSTLVVQLDEGKTLL